METTSTRAQQAQRPVDGVAAVRAVEVVKVYGSGRTAVRALDGVSVDIPAALSLSIHERTREIGLLRAVGLTRGQVRSMVRWESVLVAVFGTVGGLGLGTVLGWATMRAVALEAGIAQLAFTAPVGQLGSIGALGALVGVIAATRPARRAARLDVLVAIAAE